MNGFFQHTAAARSSARALVKTGANAHSVSVSEETLGSSQWLLELRDWIYDPELLAALGDLGARSAVRNPFFEPEMLNASHARIDPGERKMVLLWERLGETQKLMLAFPVEEQKVGFPARPVWRVQSHPFGPLSAPLMQADELEETAERFARMFPRLEGLAAKPLLFEDLPVESDSVKSLLQAMTGSGLSTVTAGRTSRAALVGDGRDNKHLKGSFPPISRKRRHEYTRQLRKLSELGEVEFSDASDFWDVMTRFEEFLVLETRSWKGRKGTSIHILRKTAAFARQSVAALADRGRASIHTLRLDGRAIASLIVLRSGDHYFPWKTAFDETYAPYSPGAHIMLHATRQMIARDGFAFADSLARRSVWLEHVWPDRLPLASVLVGSSQMTPVLNRTRKAIARRNRLKLLARKILRSR